MRKRRTQVRERESAAEPLTTIGLFAGVAGVELGMQRAGHRGLLLSEIDPDAQAVLRARFPEVRLRGDIRKIRRLPAADVWTAGFPCKDLSTAGLTKGITGRHSGVVQHGFRLLPKRGGPTWLLFENVPFMLQLDGGHAMRWLVKQLEKRGFKWAYRVIDSQCFGFQGARREARVAALEMRQGIRSEFAQYYRRSIRIVLVRRGHPDVAPDERRPIAGTGFGQCHRRYNDRSPAAVRRRASLLLHPGVGETGPHFVGLRLGEPSSNPKRRSHVARITPRSEWPAGSSRWPISCAMTKPHSRLISTWWRSA